MVPGALGGLRQVVPSLPQDTGHTPGRRQNVLRSAFIRASPYHVEDLLLPTRISGGDSDTSRGKCHGGANFLVQKSSDL